MRDLSNMSPLTNLLLSLSLDLYGEERKRRKRKHVIWQRALNADVHAVHSPYDYDDDGDGEEEERRNAFSFSVISASQMLQAGIEALFGRNRDHHRKRNYFRRVRRHQPPRHQTTEEEELAKLFLDQPETKKELQHGSTFGFGAMQGWRATMEDKHKHLIPFDSSSWKLWSYFALFDGHNGKIDRFLRD